MYDRTSSTWRREICVSLSLVHRWLLTDDLFTLDVADEVVKALDDAWLSVSPYAAKYSH